MSENNHDVKEAMANVAKSVSVAASAVANSEAVKDATQKTKDAVAAALNSEQARMAKEKLDAAMNTEAGQAVKRQYDKVMGNAQVQKGLGKIHQLWDSGAKGKCAIVGVAVLFCWFIGSCVFGGGMESKYEDMLETAFKAQGMSGEVLKKNLKKEMDEFRALPKEKQKQKFEEGQAAMKMFGVK